MPRVLVNVMESEWSVHFIGPDGQTRVGPWLLFDSHAEVIEKVLRWGGITADMLAEHERDIRRWGVSSVVLELTEAQFRALIQRGLGWPWNGYELVKMRQAGKYPPERLPVGKTKKIE